MAKEEKKKPEGDGEESAPKKPKKHLHSMTIEHVRDAKGKHKGYVVHHTYHSDPKGQMTEPSRPMAVADTADEAGQHVAEQFGAQEGGGGEPEEAVGGAPAGGAAGAEPEPGA
jgi:hypothetical protein